MASSLELFCKRGVGEGEGGIRRVAERRLGESHFEILDDESSLRIGSRQVQSSLPVLSPSMKNGHWIRSPCS
jgi:hypothetical protein